MASPVSGLGPNPQPSVRTNPGIATPTESRARVDGPAADARPATPASPSIRTEILSLLPEGERNALAGILSQARGNDIEAKLKEAAKRAEDLEKSLAQGRAGLADKFLEQMDELLSVYLLILGMAVMAGRPGLVEHYAAQAERSMASVPGWVADVRAGIAANGDAGAAAEQQRALDARVASISAKARALGNGLARVARLIESPDSERIMGSAAAILADADAAEKAARPEPGQAPVPRDPFANVPGGRGGAVSFQV